MERRIIGCAFAVANTFGTGVLEKVYENALALEPREAGMAVEQQCAVSVMYRGTVIGMYAVDLLVERTVIVELKSTKSVGDAHCAQCINYLKATGAPLYLLISFGN
ncbi:MAG TPA: GxxExxY protein [Acetobacteraceae bacterium]